MTTTTAADAVDAAALPATERAPKRSRLARVWAAVAALGAAVLGAAPHVLHHVGPLAGAAVLAGATGRLLFGAVGFVLAIPMLRRLQRRHGSWAVPGGLLALMAVVFTFSAFVIGPAVTGAGESATPAKSTPGRTVPDTTPPRVSQSEHEAHHR